MKNNFVLNQNDLLDLSKTNYILCLRYAPLFGITLHEHWVPGDRLELMSLKSAKLIFK